MSNFRQNPEGGVNVIDPKDFQIALRARVSQMADEHMQMQERIPNLVGRELLAALDELERHSIELSNLAGRLDDLDPEAK